MLRARTVLGLPRLCENLGCRWLYSLMENSRRGLPRPPRSPYTGVQKGWYTGQSAVTCNVREIASSWSPNFWDHYTYCTYILYNSMCCDTERIHTEQQVKYTFTVYTRHLGAAQRGTGSSLARSHQVTRLQCFSRGTQGEKMDIKGSHNLTIRLRELLQELKVDRHGLDLILEAVEKNLRMTGERTLFSTSLNRARDRTYMLAEDNDRHIIGELRVEVKDRTYGLLHVRS